MSETTNAGRDQKRHPVVALVLDNPISALNAAMILIGGAGVYFTNEARMTAAEKSIARIEESYKAADTEMKSMLAEARARLEIAEGRNAGKIEAISAQVTAASIKLSGIESSVRFLVDSQRRRPSD